MCVCACFHLPNVSNVKYDVNSIIRFSNVCCLFGFRERFQMSLGKSLHLFTLYSMLHTKSTRKYFLCIGHSAKPYFVRFYLNYAVFLLFLVYFSSTLKHSHAN